MPWLRLADSRSTARQRVPTRRYRSHRPTCCCIRIRESGSVGAIPTSVAEWCGSRDLEGSRSVAQGIAISPTVHRKPVLR